MLYPQNYTMRPLTRKGYDGSTSTHATFDTIEEKPVSQQHQALPVMIIGDDDASADQFLFSRKQSGTRIRNGQPAR